MKRETVLRDGRVPNMNHDLVRACRLRRVHIRRAQFDAQWGHNAFCRPITSMHMQQDSSLRAGCHNDPALEEWFGRST